MNFLWNVYKTVLWIGFGIIALFIMLISHRGQRHGH